MTFILIKPYSMTEEIKKSRFIVHASPISTPEQANDFIESMSDPSATHNCWAWKIGQQYRFNDDGEPTSTAGRPILSAIEGQDCDQVVALVIRYFGGIKLGTGGLIRAYGGSVSHCLQQAEKTPIIIRQLFTLTCLYSEWAIIENKFKELDVVVSKQDFTALGMDLTIAITENHIAQLNEFIANLTRGREILKPIE
ncbi:YigZ family protein [Orbaceae bacterium ac157xtp]